MRLSTRVKELVDQRGWSMQEFANAVGVDQATAERIYSGQSAEMDLATLSSLSQALGVTPPEIVAQVQEAQPSIGDAPSPRDPDVDVQTMDQVKKTPPEPNAGG